MNYKIVQLSLKLLKDEDLRKKAINVTIAIILAAFLIPIFIVEGIDHSFFSSNKNKNIFNTVQKEIYYKHDVVVNTDIVRAIDTVMFNGDINENIIKEIIQKYILYKQVKIVKVPVTKQEKYKVKEKKMIPVSHLIFINGKSEIVKTNEEKVVEVIKTKYVERYITKKEIIWNARNFNQTIKYMISNKYINKNQEISIKQLYQIDTMIAPNTFSPVANGNGIDPFSGQAMTHQISLSNQEFINKVGILAVQVYKMQGGEVPALTVAQAILESGWGRSDLSQQYNNLFGIKAYDWNGPKVLEPTTEYNAQNIPYHIMAYFRVYPSWKDSIIDHGNFILENSRYHNMIGVKSYVEQANDLVIDGYATNSSYANMLIGIVNEYGLSRFDNGI
ncbi:MAG: glycoside hydrolase family 73 protein [Sarcina sp.]